MLLARRKLADLRPGWATSADTKKIITAERQNLARNWLSDKGGQLVVGVAGKKALQAITPEWVNEGYSIRPIRCLERFEDYNLDSAFALAHTGGQEVECWIIGLENDYRAIYHDFLTHYFGLGADIRIASKYHVDHVLARNRADKMFSDSRKYYLRVTIAKSKSNIDAGRIYERFASERDLKPSRVLGQVPFNFPLAIKAFNLPAPESRDYSDNYVVNACRRMRKERLLPACELDCPYVLIRNVFMRSSIHPPVDNSVSLPIGNHVLKMCSPLRDWLDYYPT